MLQNLILRIRSCGNGFITQPGWLIHFGQINMIGQKFSVPIRYQLRKGISAGLALKYFGMIHRVGRIMVWDIIIWDIIGIQRYNGV